MGVKDSFTAQTRPGAYSHESDFLVPTKENTLTWGDSQPMTLAGAETATTSVQLIRVFRHRPTTFTIAIMLVLGSNWTGEGPLNLTVRYYIGVGQTKGVFVRTFTIATPTNGLAAVNDSFQLPATALQLEAQLVSSALVNPGEHTAILTALAAPVYA